MPRKNTTMDRSRQRKAKNHPTRPNKSGKIYGTPLKTDESQETKLDDEFQVDFT